MKKITLLLLALLIISVFVSCKPDHIHVFGSQWAVDETSHWHICDCGDKSDVNTHNYGEWTTTKYATLTDEGSRERACVDCNYIQKEKIEMLDENHVHTSGGPATCSKDEFCIQCGEVLAIKTGHQEMLVDAVAPTCTNSGWTAGKKCANCDKVFIESTEIAALGHNEVIDEAIDATCEEDGKTAGSHCSRCGFVFVEQKAVHCKGHDWDGGVESGGTTVYTCSTCGDTVESYKHNYSVYNGSVTAIKGGVESSANDTLAIYDGGEISSGTISTNIKLAKTTGDNGIVFGFNNAGGSNTAWEGYGISYYFFFISREGKAYLGKTNNGIWTLCSLVDFPGYLSGGTFNLKVSRDRSNSAYDFINCYIDDELYISYKDPEALDGVGFGIRAGSSGVGYDEIVVSDGVSDIASLKDYYLTSGLFVETGGKLVSKTGNSIAEVADKEFKDGILSFKMKINGFYDNGVIFSLTSNDSHAYWENNVSYYFFFINLSGQALLGKVDNGTWELCQYAEINNYDPLGTYNIRVEKEGSLISGFINDACCIYFADSSPLDGTGYGFRAGGVGTEYSNISYQSLDDVVTVDPTDLDVVSGKFGLSSDAVKSIRANNIGLIKDKTVAEGSFSAYIKCGTVYRSGLIFGYSNANGVESYYRFVSNKTNQTIEVAKVEDGIVTTIYSNYLSAGYNANKEILFRVVIKNKEAYCYFGDALYYVVDMELDGTRVGLYAESSAAQFREYSVSNDASHTTVDTLIFGHSYFELWTNYKNDLSLLATSYQLGDCLNIGIGGSIASHWNKMKDCLARYEASKAIYMIGINDLTAGVSPETLLANVRETLLYMKEANPDLEVVLVGINHCPSRSTIRDKVSSANALMRELAKEHDWISFADVEYAFCSDGANPDSFWFSDGLHLTAAGYTEKLVPAIEKALKED